jgi:hypothetical protein
MPADAFIQCRVTPEVKSPVRALAEREQITESALVRELLQLPLARGGRSGESPRLPELKWRRGAEVETVHRDHQSL